MRASAASTGFTIEVVFSDRDAEPRPRGQRTTWPLVVCGLLAMGAACAAFTASPLGQHPSVRPYTDVARAGVGAAEAGILRLAQDVRAAMR